MIVLGIETSCDETAAAITDGPTRVLSSIVAAQHDLHAEYGGVVPEIASRAHEHHILPVVRAAVRDAGIKLGDIEAVAVGHRPGLIGSLLVGVSAAKALAWSLGVPIVGVDHVHAHLHAGLLGRDAPTTLPAIGLVVSGGHSSIYLVRSWTELTRLGATIDDAIGEAFDKVAAILGLGHPGGPQIDHLAREPGADDRAFDFPISRLGKDSLDFSFSGLKTAVLYKANGTPQPPPVRGKPPLKVEPPPPMTETRRRDMAASFERAAIEAVALKVERAVAATRSHTAIQTLLVGGGVSANTRLRATLATLADRLGLELVLPPMEYCVDNAAMIAGLGAVLLDAGRSDTLDLSAVPTTAC